MNKLMKLSLLLPFFYLVSSNVVNAKGFEFLNGDGSNKTSVCVASTVSKAEWESKAASLSISGTELESFNCNGSSIESFGQKYRNKEQAADAEGPVKVFAFKAGTKNTTAQICVAGSTSNTVLFNTLKANKVAKNNVYLIKCNGMSLKRFSKKFGNKRYRV